MNNQRRLFIIIAGVAVFVGLIVVAAISISPKGTSTETLLTYTDSVTGQVRDVQPNANTDIKHGEVIVPEPSLVSITGTEDFYAKIDSGLAQAINQQLVNFVLAHGGPGVNEASIVKAKVTQTASNPTVYNFEMATKRPEAKYAVTVTMQDNDLVAPVVQVVEEQQ